MSDEDAAEDGDYIVDGDDCSGGDFDKGTCQHMYGGMVSWINENLPCCRTSRSRVAASLETIN